MGGTINYERAFFTDKYLLIHPEHEDKILQLKELIADQIPLLQVGIRYNLIDLWKLKPGLASRCCDSF